MKRIAVFCGSNYGALPAYAEAAVRLGGLLAREKIELGPAGGSAEIRKADLSSRRIDAGERRWSRAQSPAVRRGRFQQRGISSGEKGPRESAGVYSGREGSSHRLNHVPRLPCPQNQAIKRT